MSEFNDKLFKVGLPGIIEFYINKYYDLHGDLLPAEGLYHYLIKEMEKPIIEVTLRRLNGNQVKVAKLLGINRNTLRRKIKDLKISLENFSNES